MNSIFTAETRPRILSGVAICTRVERICVTTIEGLTHNAVLDSKMVSDSAVKALVDEGTHLLVGYLRGARV